MKMGDHAECKRSFSREDLFEYAALGFTSPTGEHVPEPLIGALFSCLLGVELPGSGTNYLKQETRYHRAARLGEALKARVEITRIRPEKHLVDLATTCTNESDQLIASGRALVYVRDTREVKA